MLKIVPIGHLIIGLAVQVTPFSLTWTSNHQHFDCVASLVGMVGAKLETVIVTKGYIHFLKSS